MEIAPYDDVELAAECKLEVESDRVVNVDEDVDDVAVGTSKCTVGGW